MSKNCENIFSVSKEEHGMSLLSFLKNKCPEGVSAKGLKRMIEAKLCKVNGKVEYFSSYLLSKGDEVEIRWDTVLPAKNLSKISLLYEDEDLILCNKPSGVVSEAKNFLPLVFSSKKYLELVHRLDKDTSGVLILAKNEKMRLAMKALFAKKEVHKFYLALVDGLVNKSEGKIDNYLGKKGSYEGQTLYGKVGKPELGQRAITYWRCIEKGQKASLLLCMPLTGRTHQLRVHLKEMGHPILGDYQYAKEYSCSIQPARHLLHAYALIFAHPRTQKQIRVIAPIPADFLAAAAQVKVNSHAAFDPTSLKEAITQWLE